jgi:hypothetical protein
MAWKALADRFEPTNAVDRQTLLTEVLASKLDNVSEDQERWIVEMQRMQMKIERDESSAQPSSLRNALIVNSQLWYPSFVPLNVMVLIFLSVIVKNLISF